jgi:hypothetical protein
MKPSPKAPPLVKPMGFSTNPSARHYKRHHEVQKAHLNSWNSAVLYVIFHHWLGFLGKSSPETIDFPHEMMPVFH